MSQYTSIQVFRIVLTAIALAVVVLSPTPASAAATCESLATLKLPDTTVTMAQSVAAGGFTQGGGGRGGGGFADLPAFCRVAATVKPTSDSDIKIEVWLPAASGWNGKFQGVGNGGWSGSIGTAALATALRRGYAAASTDTGHEGGNASFALGHPEKLIDYGYRAVHEMTVKGKAIVDAYYGNAPRYSYFVGCSAGGKQALKEVQRYPQDYDGVVAGAPGANWTGRSILSVWVAQATHKDEGSAIQSKFSLIHDAVVNACDANDGVKDRVLENPRQCKFDPKVLECKAGDDPAKCLTTAQVETVRKVYGPVINPRTRQEIVTGFEPGSELGWNTMAGAQPFGIGTDLFKFVVYQDPNWDYKTFNFDTDIERTLKADNNIMNALDPNLKPYFDRGGKIIQYHGWTDPQISPGNSVAYYQSVLNTMGGASKVMGNHRLFMVPGMNHCGGGDGTDTFDMVTALEQWVEKGTAPNQINATKVTNGAVTRSRPLCPYPQVATYKGSGSTDDAANFVCKKFFAAGYTDSNPCNPWLKILWSFDMPISRALILIAILPISALAAVPCESLSTLSLPNTTITMAQSVAAGAFAPPAPPRGAGARGGRGAGARGGDGARGDGRGAAAGPQFDFKTVPAFCRVAATLKPSSDSDIKVEVWLPMTGWNGKLQSVGNGAWAGSIGYNAIGTAVVAGYAAASTDTGHTGNNADFILGHPEKLTDFAYRSVHEMTVAAKAIINAFYGSGPRLSYFNGCSTGGKQAITEAQRYPRDYDGIIAGAPAIYATHLQGMQTWVGAMAHQVEGALIPANKAAVLKSAVLDACDALDGVKDGVLEDPRACRFDPKALECKSGDGPSCLTASQVDLARKIYQGPVNKKGRELFPGLERGTESGWNTLAGAQPMSLAVETFSHATFQNPKWDYRTFDFERDVAIADKTIGATMNSIDPNLKPFFDRGGKLLIYHGWADPGIAPRNSVNYYTNVINKVGKSKAANSIRLFMVPGMGHCSGGDGTSTFDKLEPLDKWVETGKTPDHIIASRVRNGATDRTRPLCPYPQVATYKGSGSIDDAANFVCRAPR